MLLQKYETTFNFEFKDDDNRGLYKASDDDIQKEIDDRKKLLEEAENLYTPVKLQKINKDKKINSKEFFKRLPLIGFNISILAIVSSIGFRFLSLPLMQIPLEIGFDSSSVLKTFFTFT